MDKLSEHAIRMLEIVDNERGFYKDMDGEVADIARAVYDLILQVQMLKMADRKTENSSEIPNNSTSSKMEQVDEPQTCDTCKYGEDKHRYAHICNECGVGINNYEPKDETQKWTKENCKGCKYNEYPYDSGTCFVRVCINGNKYEPKTADGDGEVSAR